MPSHTPRITRVYPRLDVGGAERGILQLLASLPDTHMVVSHVEGLLAPRARTLAARYTLCRPPRFAALLDALSGAEVVHIHTINDHPLIPLAAQLAGPRVLVQTVHNRLEAWYSLWVDHSIALGPESAGLLDAPARTTVIPNAVEAPADLPPFAPWTAEGRPLRLVEVRRPDKEMAFTLEALLAEPALRSLECEARIVGCDGRPPDPRITYLGPLDDPADEVARADLLVHGSATETFGRTVVEAMGWGTVPFATPLPAFTDTFPPGGAIAYAPGLETGTAAVALAALVEGPLADPDRHARWRADNHRRVRERFSVEAMAAATAGLYEQVADADPRGERNLGPDDLPEGDRELFGALVDDLLESNPPRLVNRNGELSPRARGIYLWLLTHSGRVAPAQALPLLAQSFQLLGDRPILLLDLARAFRGAGRASDATTLLARYNDRRPWSLVGWFERLDLLVAGGDAAGARAVLHEALAHNPGVPALEGLRGRASGQGSST